MLFLWADWYGPELEVGHIEVKISNLISIFSRNHWHGRVRAMDEIEPLELLQQRVCVFVCSTTGQGEEPDNMRQLWRFLLLRSLPSTSLLKLKFGVLGLGDSSYAKFNFVAKRLHKRLVQLGATPLCPAGLADDQHDLGPDAVVEPWTIALWDTLDQLNPPSEQQKLW